jgi:hypothetical protein
MHRKLFGMVAILVLHDGHWTNPGWRTDAEK